MTETIFAMAYSDGGIYTEWFHTTEEAEAWLKPFAMRGWNTTVKDKG